MIPYSRVFDQQTMTLMLEHDALVQRFRTFFALFDWRVVPEPAIDPSRPGKRPHPQAAYLKALLLKVAEELTVCTRLRRFLVEHPLLVLELGFRPVLDFTQPYGFNVERTVPTARHGCVRNNTRSHKACCKPCSWRRSVPCAKKSLAWAKSSPSMSPTSTPGCARTTHGSASKEPLMSLISPKATPIV